MKPHRFEPKGPGTAGSVCVYVGCGKSANAAAHKHFAQNISHAKTELSILTSTMIGLLNEVDKQRADVITGQVNNLCLPSRDHFDRLWRQTEEALARFE